MSEFITIITALSYQARTSPDQEACCFSNKSISYATLWKKIKGFAGYLKKNHLSPTTRVIIALPNSFDFLFTFFGTLLAGGIAVPIFSESSRERLLYFASICQAEFVITGKFQAEIEKTDFKKNCQKKGIQPIIISEDCPSHELVIRESAVPSPEDTAYIQFTSGSTGTPKGVMISHKNLITNIKQLIAGFKISREDIFINWLPIYHDMGLILMTMVPFFLGARLIILPATLKNIRNWIEAIDHHRGTFTAAPDFAYRLCLTYINKPEQYDLSCLRIALNAAEPVRIKTIKEFEGKFNLSNVMIPAYGLAEATVGVSTWPVGTEVKTDKNGCVSVGQPFPGISIKISKTSGKSNRKAIGEILVKSPANTKGYWHDCRTSKRMYTEDHYLHTGDLGYIDDENHLFIAGRKKNMIIQGGRNIAPREVEELVDQFSFVRRSAALGIDTGGRQGEQVYIFVELRTKKIPPESELFENSIKITNSFYRYFGFRPGKVFQVKPGTIPFTQNGKLRYRELKRRFLSKSYLPKRDILYPFY